MQGGIGLENKVKAVAASQCAHWCGSPPVEWVRLTGGIFVRLLLEEMSRSDRGGGDPV